MESSRSTVTLTETNKILRLKPERKAVKFTEDTIDNEEMQKKKSNSNLYLVCCIYRRKDCSSDSSSEEDTNDYERQPKYTKHLCK
jgi:Protein phosphatase inhibitor